MKECKRFSESGQAMVKIARRLCKDETLCKLLKHTNRDPLATELDPEATVFLDNITIVPKVDFDNFLETKIVINLPEIDSNPTNDDFSNTVVIIDIFSTMDQWIINDDLIRPLSICDCIINDLNQKRVTSIGTLQFKSVTLDTVSNEITCHRMAFEVNTNG